MVRLSCPSVSPVRRAECRARPSRPSVPPVRPARLSRLYFQDHKLLEWLDTQICQDHNFLDWLDTQYFQDPKS